MKSLKDTLIEYGIEIPAEKLTEFGNMQVGNQEEINTIVQSRVARVSQKADKELSTLRKQLEEYDNLLSENTILKNTNTKLNSELTAVKVKEDYNTFVNNLWNQDSIPKPVAGKTDKILKQLEISPTTFKTKSVDEWKQQVENLATEEKQWFQSAEVNTASQLKPTPGEVIPGDNPKNNSDDSDEVLPQNIYRSEDGGTPVSG